MRIRDGAMSLMGRSTLACSSLETVHQRSSSTVPVRTGGIVAPEIPGNASSRRGSPASAASARTIPEHHARPGREPTVSAVVRSAHPSRSSGPMPAGTVARRVRCAGPVRAQAPSTAVMRHGSAPRQGTHVVRRTLCARARPPGCAMPRSRRSALPIYARTARAPPHAWTMTGARTGTPVSRGPAASGARPR